MSSIIRMRVWLVAMFVVCSTALGGAARAQVVDASRYVEFRDTLPASRSAAHKIRPWQESEKATVLAYLNAVHEAAPGLLARAGDRDRVQLWRLADRAGAIAARAFYGENAIGFEEPFFRAATQERPALKQGTATLSHELTHLADSNNRLGWSKEWSRMVLSRMRRVQAQSRNTFKRTIFEFSTWPDRKARQDLDENARGQGMPNAYACANLQESLAESACMLVSKQYAPPDDMDRYLRENLLSANARLSGAERLMNQANTALENKNYTELLRLSGEVIEQDAEFVRAYYLKSIALEMQRQRPAAIAALTRAIELFPGNYHDAFAYRGQLWAASGQSAKAIADFSVCVEEYGVYQANQNVFLRRGKEWEKQREWGKAADDFEAAVRAWPGNEESRKIYSARLTEIQRQAEQCTEDLSAPDAWVRLGAAKNLGKLGTTAAIALPRLENAANDSDEDVRLVATASLRRILTALTALRPGPLPGGGSILGTKWTGTEDLPGWGEVSFQFRQDAEVLMIDAKKTIKGTWWQAFDQVILTFQNCVYVGRITGDVLLGNARFTTGEPRDWTWRVVRGADPPPQIASTFWSGTETLGDYGTLTFRFEPNDEVFMFDAKKIVRGTWSQNGNKVTITFQNCVYQATVQGDTMSGNAYFTTDDRTWTFSLTYGGTVTPQSHSGLRVDGGPTAAQVQPPQPPVPQVPGLDHPDVAAALLKKDAYRIVRPLVELETATFRLREARGRLQAERDRIVPFQREPGYAALATTYRQNRTAYVASRASLDYKRVALRGALEPDRLITLENQALWVDRWGHLLEWRQRRETIHDAEAAIVDATQLYDLGVPSDVPDALPVVRPPDRSLVGSTWRNEWSDGWAQWRFSANNDFHYSTNLMTAEKSGWWRQSGNVVDAGYTYTAGGIVYTHTFHITIVNDREARCTSTWRDNRGSRPGSTITIRRVN